MMLSNPETKEKSSEQIFEEIRIACRFPLWANIPFFGYIIYAILVGFRIRKKIANYGIESYIKNESVSEIMNKHRSEIFAWSMFSKNFAKSYVIFLAFGLFVISLYASIIFPILYYLFVVRAAIKKSAKEFNEIEKKRRDNLEKDIF